MQLRNISTQKKHEDAETYQENI